MHFRLRYVMEGMRLELGKDETLRFRFGRENAVVVTVLRLVEESNPQKTNPICEGACEQDVEQSVQEEFQRFSTGGPLEPTSRAFFAHLLSDLFDYMQKVIFRFALALLSHGRTDESV